MFLNQKGTVLATALIFLSLLTILSLTGLEMSQLELHMSNNLSTQLQEFHSTEAVLKQAEKKLSLHQIDKVCEEKLLSPLQLNNVKQYERNNCLINYHGVSVYYLFTPLPGDVFVSTKDGKIFQGAYYQVSAWGRLLNDLPTLLQSTDVVVAQEQNIKADISKNTPIIALGRMSWRQL